MNEPITPDIGYCTLLIICGLAGSTADVVTEAHHRLLINVLIGLAGSWIGSQFAYLTGVVVRGSLGHFTAALAGSILIASIWQKLHTRRRSGSSRAYLD